MIEKKESHVHFRVSARMKALFVKKANKGGLKLSEWIIAELKKSLR